MSDEKDNVIPFRQKLKQAFELGSPYLNIYPSDGAKNDGYITVYPQQPNVIPKGIRCGLCHLTFDYLTPSSYYCSNKDCPVQLKAR